MKNEYDFSAGERGKFYRPDARLNLPIYLEEEVLGYPSAGSRFALARNRSDVEE
jgi:hypothetical protein